jgi:hypothetical protein
MRQTIDTDFQQILRSQKHEATRFNASDWQKHGRWLASPTKSTVEYTPHTTIAAIIGMRAVCLVKCRHARLTQSTVVHRTVGEGSAAPTAMGGGRCERQC